MRQDWEDKFLEALRQTPNVSEACRRAEITRPTAYNLRVADPAFAAAWDDALEESTDDLVGECYRRAREGCERDVFYKGLPCGQVREYSDTLAIFLLKAHRSDVYGDKSRIEFKNVPDEELVARATGIVRGGGQAGPDPSADA